MANEYQAAKKVFNDHVLFHYEIIKVNNVANFRKYLSEMILRQKSDKRFTTNVLDKNTIEVVRIK